VTTPRLRLERKGSRALAALDLKKGGLEWHPHVGCFVWDPDEIIDAESPFPARVYFILDLPRFVGIFGSIEKMVEKLVWLPTWHQARLLCRRMGIGEEDVGEIERFGSSTGAAEELRRLYRLIHAALEDKSPRI